MQEHIQEIILTLIVSISSFLYPQHHSRMFILQADQVIIHVQAIIFLVLMPQC
jgi:hypothetical protein